MNETTLRDKIRKLLALAADASAGEAATAADMAARLMTEHSITLAEVAASAPRERTAIGVRRVDISAAIWEAMLINCVAQSMGGATVRSTAGGGTVLVVYAPESVVDSIIDLAQFIRLQVLREVQREAHKSNGEGVRAWKRSYIIGAIGRVGERMREARQVAVAASAASAGSGLMVLSGAVKARMREDFPRLRNVRTSVSSRDGRSAGRAAGDRIDIGQRGVSGTRALPC